MGVSIPMPSEGNTSLAVGVQSVEYRVETNVVSLTHSTGGFEAVIDSTLPYLWLPPTVCDSLADMFRLTYDNTTGLYTVNETAHNFNLQQKASLAFKVGASSGPSNSFTSIVLPYRALDLDASFPIYENATNYFPIKRSTGQLVLGRAFLQETYLTVDYERLNFTVSPANYTTPMPPSYVIPVLSKSHIASLSGHSGLPHGALAGIAAGAAIGLLLLLAGAFYAWRRRRNGNPYQKHVPGMKSAGGDAEAKDRRASELSSNPPGYEERDTKGSVCMPIEEEPHEMDSPSVFEMESPPLGGAGLRTPRSPRCESTECFERRARQGSRLSGTLSQVHELAGDDGRFNVHGQHFEPVHSRGLSEVSSASAKMRGHAPTPDRLDEQLEDWALGKQSPTEMEDTARLDEEDDDTLEDMATHGSELRSSGASRAV